MVHPIRTLNEYLDKISEDSFSFKYAIGCLPVIGRIISIWKAHRLFNQATSKADLEKLDRRYGPIDPETLFTRGFIGGSIAVGIISTFTPYAVFVALYFTHLFCCLTELGNSVYLHNKIKNKESTEQAHPASS